MNGFADERAVDDSDAKAAAQSGDAEEETLAIENALINDPGETLYNDGDIVFNNYGTVFNNGGIVFNNGGVVFNNEGTVSVRPSISTKSE